jgi:hypothetical protein
MFRRNLWAPSSGSKIKPSKKTSVKAGDLFALASHSTYSSTLKMEWIFSAEKLFDFQRPTRPCISLLVSLCLAFNLSACNNIRTTEQIFMKSDNWDFTQTSRHTATSVEIDCNNGHLH